MKESGKQRAVIGIVVALGVVGALVWRATQNPEPAAAAAAQATPTKALPRLLELGSDKCVSCKAMMPVLDELREAHADTLQVDFLDVFKEPQKAEAMKAQIIPAQAFFAPDGRELYRHEGFWSAESIRAKWAELGYPIVAAAAAAPVN